jgi:GNAT superfamily N-acetyltransferase
LYFLSYFKDQARKDCREMEWQRGKFLITDDSDRVYLDLVHEMLSQSYWAANRPRHLNAKAIANSLCFSILDKNRQVGFARVVTDEATFAWIADVIIHPDYRGQGLGKWLMECVTNHPALVGTLQLLKTRDAHGLYLKFGFEHDKCMTVRNTPLVADDQLRLEI